MTNNILDDFFEQSLWMEEDADNFIYDRDSDEVFSFF